MGARRKTWASSQAILRITVTAVLVTVSAASGYSRARAEQDSSTTLKNSVSELKAGVPDPRQPAHAVEVNLFTGPLRTVSLLVKSDFGATRIDIRAKVLDIWTGVSVLVRKGNEYFYYYNYRGGGKVVSVSVADAAITMAQVRSFQASDSDNTPSWASYWGLQGERRAGTIGPESLPFLTGLPSDEATDRTATVVFDSFGPNDFDLVVLFALPSGDYQFEAFDGTVYLESFAGEKDLFEAKLAGVQGYKSRALSFFWWVLTSGDADMKSLYKSTIEAAFPDVALTDMSAILDAARSSGEMLGGRRLTDILANCRRSIAQSFLLNSLIVKEPASGRELVMPTLAYGWNAFSAIYGSWGKGRRNPYIAAYLAFAFAEQGTSKRAMPVLSLLYQKALADVGVEYDYRQYRPVTEQEGQAIARSALKYLDWGVEYTPYSGTEQWLAGNAGRRVYADNKQEIENWITNGNISSQEIPSALLGIGETNSAPMKVHILDVSIETQKVMLAAKLSKSGGTYANLDVSRIDIWNAENLAWKQGVVQGTYPAQKSELLDKDRSVSLTLSRGSDPVAVGYDFGDVQMVGAVILAANNNYSAGNRELTRIEVRNGATATILTPKYDRTVGAKFVEYYTTVDAAGQVRALVRNDSARTTNDGQTRYWYYLFAQPVPATSLKVVLGGASQTRIEEMMVFASNPIGYITGDAMASRYDYTAVVAATALGAKRENDLASADYIQQAVEDDLLFNTDARIGRRELFIGSIGGSDKDVLNIRQGPSTARTTILGKFQPRDVGEVWETTGGFDPGAWHWIRQVSRGAGQRTFAEGFADTNYGVAQKVFSPSESVALVSLNFKSTVSIAQVVIWETGGSFTASTALQKEFVVLTGANDFLLDMLLTEGPEEIVLPTFSLTTPFVGKTPGPLVLAKAGNPLPYAPIGIDTPRTFAYKMTQQVVARDWYLARNATSKSIVDSFPPAGTLTTRAVDGAGVENYTHSYVNESMVLSAAGHPVSLNPGSFIYRGYPAVEDLPLVKPFLPGYLGLDAAGYIDVSKGQSPFNADKSAGVDAYGLLMGALYDANQKGLVDLWNSELGEQFKRYASMTPADGGSGGLDAQGLPLYYASTGNTLTATKYAPAKIDLERSTLLVPDISLAREGDLLVGNTGGSEPDIGIIVGVPEDPTLKYGADARDWWSKVLVLSVRRAFRMVTLGVWGSSSNVFGGFSSSPESYQIRRLVVKRDPFPEASRVVDKWALVDEVVSKTYEVYPSLAEAPDTFGFVDASSLSQASEQIKGYEANVAPDDELSFRPVAYLRELPPKSSTEGYARRSVFDIPPAKLGQWKMRLTSYTGWRLFANDGQASYHLGIDLVPPGTVADQSIRAPEAGVFWFVHSEGAESYRIRLPGGSTLNFRNSYNDGAFGIVTVLVTHPEKLAGNLGMDRGRIYVFCHQGSKNGTMQSGLSALSTAFAQRYPGRTFPEVVGTDAPQDGQLVRVDESDWIGIMGDRGKTDGAHVHLEVYEWFAGVARTDNTPYTPPEGGRWIRINARTLFPSSWITDGAEDGASAIMPFMSAAEQKQFFRTWGATDENPGVG